MNSLRRRYLTYALVALVALVCAGPQPAFAQQLQIPRLSQRATVTQRIGLTDVTINYGRPGVRGRQIWGALVPYDQVWRTGSDEATTFIVSHDVSINGQPLPAGSYSLHTIPARNEWTIIFNKVADQWGSYQYNQAQDALRVTARAHAADLQEWFMISFPDATDSSATVMLHWERVRVPFTINVNTAERVTTSARQAVNNLWRTPYAAADYLVRINGNMDDAMRYVNQSVALQETFQNLGLKARLLARAGNTAEAITTAERALQRARASQQPPDTSALERELTEWRGRRD